MASHWARNIILLVVILMSAGTAPIPAADPAAFASGERAATLIELFTSEGCSSCPPAEAWMRRLKMNAELWKSIVPAVFHVDYWDGLGWPDRFAKAEFTQRQRQYTAAWPAGEVYTPAFVLNGKEWRGFFSRESPPPARSDKVGVLQATLTGEHQVRATFAPGNSNRGPFKLGAALLGCDLQSNVTRGENSGRKLEHDFVVLQFAEVGMVADRDHWNGSLSFSTNAAADKPKALAAWVIAGDVPIQATGGWLGANH